MSVTISKIIFLVYLYYLSPPIRMSVPYLSCSGLHLQYLEQGLEYSRRPINSYCMDEGMNPSLTWHVSDLGFFPTRDVAALHLRVCLSRSRGFDFKSDLLGVSQEGCFRFTFAWQHKPQSTTHSENMPLPSWDLHIQCIYSTSQTLIFFLPLGKL